MIRHRFPSAARAFTLFAVLSLVGCAGDTTPPADSAGDDDAVADGLPVQACASEKWAQGFQSDGCTMFDGSNPPVSSGYWPDVCSPATVGWSPSQSSFDQLSWRSFFNTSWPAQADGQPDTGKALGVPEDGVFLPTVWERYKNAQDLFGDGGAGLTAADYSAPSPVPDSCDPDGPRVLSMTSKFPHTSVAAVADALTGDESLSSIDQAFRGPLYPQGPPDPLLPVYYEIRINDIEFAAIVKAGAQTKSPAELNCTGAYDTEDCKPFTFPLQSAEVKAAWKVLSEDEVASGRFFHQELQIEDPGTGTCLVEPMGLVGLHIARKVKHAISGDDHGRKNSWAWATFEHNANVPPVGSDGSDGSYSFFNADCTPAVDAATCAAVKTPDPDNAYQCCENLYRYAAGTVPADPTPGQVTRIDPVPEQTQACNAVYAEVDKGVFDNYNLVVTQWPKKNDDGGSDIVTPTYARNTVIETYFTKWDSGQQVNTSSCMGCHSGRNAVDMSYLFLGNSGT